MDLFKFPFHADVWGTASEWVMIIVTMITAYFLWKTLKSQKEVQETQNKLLKIEHLRLREDFKPKLSYSRFLENFKIDDPDRIPICIAVRNLSANVALNFQGKLLKLDDSIKQIIFKPPVFTLSNDGPNAELYFLVKHIQGQNLNCTIYLSIEYEDVVGTKYTQTIAFDAFAGIEEFRTFDPMIVKETDL